MTKECGTPGDVWKKQRKLYKKCIIYDRPGSIPKEVAKHLESDFERLMYKCAKRTVQMCLDNDLCRDGFEEYPPKEMMKKLNNFKVKGETRAIRQMKVIYRLDDMIRDGWFQDESEDYLDIINHQKPALSLMHVFDDVLCRHEKSMAENLEIIKNDPDTFEVKGSKGDIYFVNKEEYFCTCLGFKYRNECKHLKQRRKQ
jgi:hypothetical protein